jgi:hypothetical protein
MEPVHEELLGTARHRLHQRQIDVHATTGGTRALEAGQGRDRDVRPGRVEALRPQTFSGFSAVPDTARTPPSAAATRSLAR